ncbi:uncharacterized protein wu:fa56d06 [Colossoma macropomum]|uniref:uncharacterized protein wu:fa56d06 n=1 Tax=Colossoma macropomum TaxID=42526 RepID=UPI001863F52A|nr:uncharacterized protein wu:fa56d06 [Colossoma macropomum]
MLKAVLLLFALAGLHARPLQNDALWFQNGGWVIRAPQLVQDEYMDNLVHSEHRRLDTAPSTNFLMNLNNGLLKKHSSEIGKSVGESEPQWEVVLAADNEVKVQDNPNQKAAPVEDRRQGTEPSRRFLMDVNTGMLKKHVSEMDRRVAGFYNYPSNYEFRQGTQNSQATLVDIRTGQLLGPFSEMQRRAAPVEAQGNGVEQKLESQKAVPVEFRRQGTEPSRRFLVDLNTGLLKEHVSEMNRRVSGYYNPPSNYEFRQGTENSQRTLVDIHTGLHLAQLSEMQRRAAPLYEFSQGTEYSPVTLMELRKAQMMRGMERAEVSKDETDAQDTSHKAVPPKLQRQGTEPSGRFLMDLNTGMLKEHTSEMDRRVAGFYNYPSNYEFRQGTENSQATLVDMKTGQLLAPLSEMQRRTALLSQQGTKYSQEISKLQNNYIVENLQSNEVKVPEHPQTTELHKALEMNEVDVSVMEEFRHGMEYSHANKIDNHIMEPSKVKKNEGVALCQGEVIDGNCYLFNPDLLTFSEAEASCKRLSSLGHLASVTSVDLHARLVAMVTRAKSDRVLTWLGGIMKNNQFEWIDGSSWGYSDWMPGHPRLLEQKQSCVEMFRIDESWWTAVDCGLKRASICSYPVMA